MGLTDNQKGLIKCIAENNMQKARQYAIACVTEDTTSKNSAFCGRYKKILEASGTNLLEVPANLKNILIVEDVSNSFIEDRYYLSEREKDTYNQIVRMNNASQKLQEMKIPYANTTILYGKSGTGKTLFGRYVAYKLDLPFAYLNFAYAIDSYLGGTSKNLSLAFNHATQNPCVFMLDEIDCISMKRTSRSDSGSDGELNRTTITLMQQLERIPNDVIVLAATNRIDRIDEAVLRRMSLKREIEEFSKTEKLEMSKQFLRSVGIDIPNEEIEKLSSRDVNQSYLINELIALIAKRIEC